MERLELLPLCPRKPIALCYVCAAPIILRESDLRRMHKGCADYCPLAIVVFASLRAHVLTRLQMRREAIASASATQTDEDEDALAAGEGQVHEKYSNRN